MLLLLLLLLHGPLAVEETLEILQGNSLNEASFLSISMFIFHS